MKRASLLIVALWGILATGVGTASAEPRRARGGEPKVVAESVVDGVRRVNIEVPRRETRSMLGVTLACPDGTQLPEQEFPLYDGMLTVPVSVCPGGVDATMAVLPVKRYTSRCRAGVDWFHTAIPALGEVNPPPAAVTAAKRSCACPSWPSVPVGVALFGLLPFALGYVTVATLRRRR